MLQLDTFEQKEKIVDDYMKVMRESIKEAYYSGEYSKVITKPSLQYEQLLCEQSIHNKISHIASSQINDIFIENSIEPDQVDTKTYKQIEMLYLHKKIGMLEELIHIIDPKKDFKTAAQPIMTPSTTSGITFKQLYEIFLVQKKEDAPTLSQTTWRDYQSAYDDFIYVIEDAEDKDISEFTKDHFREFIKALHSVLPSNRTKKKEYRNLSIEQLKAIELPDTEKMAIDTKKKKISSIKQIFDIAIDPRYGYLTDNHAEAFLIKEPKNKPNNAPKPRDELTPENLQKLFSSKLYTNPKIKIDKAEQYWIPLIALFTGMRQNEICQLKISDVKYEVVDYEDRQETIWYFDINESNDKHLKNDNATRLMPLHQKLIELGFLEYFEATQKISDQLWPNLRLHPSEKRYNIDYGKTFMKFFRAHISRNEKQVFHSIRHNVSDQLLKNAIHHRLPKELMNVLLGHEPDKDMTSSTYGSGYSVKELYEGIKTLRFPTLKLL